MSLLPRLGAVTTIGLAAALAVAAPVEAQIRFTGSTLGCFEIGCSPMATATFGGVTFTQGTFNGLAIFNPLANVFQLAIEDGAGTLGTLDLNTTAAVYNVPFFLRVMFTSPVAGSDALFSAFLRGVVNPSFPDGGGVRMDFSPDAQNFTFVTDEGLPGVGTLVVNDLSVNPGSSQAITGFVSAEVVPEPATMALLGTGLFGLAGAARRRRERESAAAE